MFGRRLFVAAVMIVGIAGTACQPIIPLTGGGGTPCFIGSYTKLGQQVAALVNSSALAQLVTVTAISGGTGSLNVAGTASSGTWTLAATQSFTVVSTQSGGPINGTATITGLTASGTYTATSTTITLTLTPSGLGGTFAFSGQPGNIGPMPVASVTQYLPVDELLGFSGTANWTCTANGPTFTFNVTDSAGHLSHIEEDY